MIFKKIEPKAMNFWKSRWMKDTNLGSDHIRFLEIWLENEAVEKIKVVNVAKVGELRDKSVPYFQQEYDLFPWIGEQPYIQMLILYFSNNLDIYD